MKHLTNNKFNSLIKESITKVLNEGIDFDPYTKTVSYNPSHEENVDTSIENNPSIDGNIVPNIKVWSIFKRKKGLRGDGNPLIYALKGEGWKFKTENDRIAILNQFNQIAEKFVSLYPVGVTILMPSSNNLNKYIGDIIVSKTENCEIIEGVVCKLTTEEVENIVLDFDSEFRKKYANNFNEAYYELTRYLDIMDKTKNGYFTRHLVTNSEMRDVLDFTLKISTDRFAEFANKINGQDILIIDDTISRGQSIKDICKIITQSYQPKSITVLTLLSKLN